MERQRELLAELVEALVDRGPDALDRPFADDWAAAADDAGRLRVVVDQVASLTDALRRLPDTARPASGRRPATVDSATWQGGSGTTTSRRSARRRASTRSSRDYVTLRNAGGGSLKGLCPFHDEKSPSFHVTPARQFFHCFGCSEGGDVFTFLMKIDGLGFTEAVERLADKYGVQLRREDGPGPPAGDRGPQRGRLIEANKQAQEFYADTLTAPTRSSARQFLAERGFDKDSAETFGVGFAPRDGEALLKHLRQKGFSEEELVAAGLVGRAAAGPTTASAVGCCGRSATPAAT